MREHLTDLELEMARTGEAELDLKAHLEECAECQDEKAFLENLATAMGQPTPALDVPKELDDAIFNMINRRGDSIREGMKQKSDTRGPKGAMRWILPVAAAASIALALGISRIAIKSTKKPVGNQIALVGSDDINGDGRVDIVDAFVLARAIETGASVGGLDHQDVDRIARAAVALNSGGDR